MSGSRRMSSAAQSTPSGGPGEGPGKEAAEPLWSPCRDRVEHAQLTHFHAWAAGLFAAPALIPDDPRASYQALHGWSVREPEAFWRAVAEWFDVRFSSLYETV